MLKRPIPATGELLPVIGCGTWNTFNVGPAGQAPLRDVLRQLFDGGGAVVDSSPMYGRAEGVAGALVEEMGARGRAFIATKVWTHGREAGVAQIARSHELLRAPVLDLVQIHNRQRSRAGCATSASPTSRRAPMPTCWR